MKKFGVCILILKLIYTQGVESKDEGAGDDYYSYEYASAEETTDTGSGGQRLVGAARADIDKIPFLVGYSFQNPEGKLHYGIECTGSLIASQWVLSAAHCTFHLVNRDDIPECIEATKAEGKYTFTRHGSQNEIRCEYASKGKSIKIFPIKPAGVAFLGASDNNDIEKIKEVKPIKIDYVIRHEKSYRGGGSYGTYGGYDITLLHLAEKAKAQCKTCPKPINACLPRKSFQDSGLGTFYNTGGANLAGYGKFMRKACQTDEYGESKYHYCTKPTRCETGPPPLPNVCKDFFNNQKTPNSIPKDLTEIVVTDQTGDNYCTRSASPKPGSKGWCHVKVDAAQHMGLTRLHQSWGFCSEDCYDYKKNESQFNILRQVPDVDVLNDDLCDMYLKNAMPNGKLTEVKPEILCIGKIEHLKYDQWFKNGNTYRKNRKRMENHNMSIFKGINNYVRAVGTCNGDSGGPVFVKKQGRHIVLGVVSGGRGALRDCGGVNNPTHYARASAFGTWITIMLGPDARDLCWFDQNGYEKELTTEKPKSKSFIGQNKKQSNWNENRANKNRNRGNQNRNWANWTPK